MPDEPIPAWIDTPEGVRLAANVCASAGRFALDTEADSMHSYYHKVCLMQLSAGDDHFVIDPLALDPESFAPLWLVVADPGLTMVMHGSDYDIRVMDRDFGARVAGLEDTQIMAQLLGEAKTGLGALLEQEFGRQLDKRYQRADWGRRPLTPEMVAYAAADTAYLIDLADRLRARLEELGRWSWAQQEFRKLEQVRHQRVAPDPLAFERVKGARSLKGGARDRMHELFEWREQQARRRDLPPFKILGNRQMLLLAEKAPSDLQQIARLEGLGPRFVRRWGQEVVRRLQRPRSAPPRPVGERRRAASAQVRRRMQHLLEARAKVAEALGLQPGLICPKALVESVAETPSILDTGSGQEFDGWRLELLREPFRRALGGGVMRPADACIVDLDGTLYFGGQPIPGASDAIAALRTAGIGLRFTTNTTRKPRSALVRKLVEMGIDVRPEEMHTAPVAAARWLADEDSRRISLLLAEGTFEEFSDFVLDDDQPDHVVVGDLAEAWSFDVLNRAFRALVSGARLVAIQKNRSWDAGHGLQLDAGPFIAALEYATGQEAVLVGKPSSPFFHTAASGLGVSRDRIAVVGDSLENDAQGGQRAGCLGVVVRTGTFREDRLAGLATQPDAVLDSIAELPRWLGI